MKPVFGGFDTRLKLIKFGLGTSEKLRFHANGEQ